jgi:hypothetical protein
MMNDIFGTASTVSDQLFGPNAGIPWWAWMFVLVALLWKLGLPEPKAVRSPAEDRDGALLAAMSGKKGKSMK